MKLVRRLLILMTMSLVVAVAEDSLEEEIIIADMRIDWGNSPAFYIDAASSVRAAMELDLKRFMVEVPTFCDETDGTMWVCEDAELRFFSAVSGNGEQLYSGFACHIDKSIPLQKYYSDRLLSRRNCIEMNWYEDEARYVPMLTEDW